jgi:proline dehydrogenase
VEGEKSEMGFAQTLKEILHTFDRALGRKDVPFCVFKVTGIADASLLEKVQSRQTLSVDEQLAMQKVKERLVKICSRALESGVPVLVDAEETWIQDTIDSMVYEMMMQFNCERTVVYNTFQMYRTDMLKNLKEAFHNAAMHQYYLGAKLVRGAYMEKERERAKEQGYESPIHPDKEATDAAFNRALGFCVDNKQRISLMCGSHNEYSNYYLTILMQKHSMAPDDPRVWFAQLYGMSDNISFNLAKAGFNVAKYVPYGPVRSVMPYLLRRADENTSVAGQSSRELILIQKELRRRQNSKNI